MYNINIATQQAGLWNGEGHDEKSSNEKQVKLPESAEELQLLVQAEADRRVTQALRTAQEKWRQKFALQLAEERKEAQRLIKLTAEQKEKEVLERYGKEIEEMEKALKLKELEIKVINLLAEREIPFEFKDFILDKDEEKTSRKLESFCSLWRLRFEEAVRNYASRTVEESQ